MFAVRGSDETVHKQQQGKATTSHSSTSSFAPKLTLHTSRDAGESTIPIIVSSSPHSIAATTNNTTTISSNNNTFNRVLSVDSHTINNTNSAAISQNPSALPSPTTTNFVGNNPHTATHLNKLNSPKAINRIGNKTLNPLIPAEFDSNNHSRSNSNLSTDSTVNPNDSKPHLSPNVGTINNHASNRRSSYSINTVDAVPE